MSKIFYPSSIIYAAPSSISGLGVFAKKEIQEGEIIEECPIVEISEDELSNLTKTKLLEYYFAWEKNFKSAAIVLGYGSLYNHSYEPNAKYIKDMDDKTVRFVALKKIEQEQEILVNYNGHPDDKTKLWFEMRNKFF